MVVTCKDFIPPRHGGKHQNCPAQSDRTDSDSQVGKFCVKKDQTNSTLESGYYSAGLVTAGSVVPLPSYQTHTSAGQVSVKEGGEALSNDAEADGGVHGIGKRLSQESNDTDQFKLILLSQMQMLGFLPLVMSLTPMLACLSLTRLGRQ